MLKGNVPCPALWAKSKGRFRTLRDVSGTLRDVSGTLRDVKHERPVPSRCALKNRFYPLSLRKKTSRKQRKFIMFAENNICRKELQWLFCEFPHSYNFDAEKTEKHTVFRNPSKRDGLSHKNDSTLTKSSWKTCDKTARNMHPIMLRLPIHPFIACFGTLREPSVRTPACTEKSTVYLYLCEKRHPENEENSWFARTKLLAQDATVAFLWVSALVQFRREKIRKTHSFPQPFKARRSND